MGKTINDKISDNKRRETQDNLKRFDKIIKLVEKYPPQIMRTPPFVPYTVSGILYNPFESL